MAKTETLTLKVEAQLQSALADVKRLEKEVETLRRTAEKPIDLEVDTSDAQRGMQQLSEEFKKVTDAPKVDVELGSSVPRVRDTLEHITDIFDEIDGESAKVDLEVDTGTAEGDLDKVDTDLKEIDGKTAKATVTVDTSGATTAMSKARTEVDAIPRSAGGANSALANMYGNVAGEAGAVFGAIGPVNVAIGQMAEYAADAKFEGEALGSALGSMAKIAGPIAALSLGLKVVSDIMGAIKAEEAFDADLVKRFTAALREGETVAGEILDIVSETNALIFPTGPLQGGGIFGLGGENQDLLDTFLELGLSAQEAYALIADPSAAVDALNQLGDTAFETAKDFDVGSDERDFWERRAVLYHDAADGLEHFAVTSEDAAARAKLVEDILEPQRIEEFADAVAKIDFDPLESDVFKELVADVKDGTIDMANFDAVVAQLANTWGISTEEVRQYILQEADKQLDDEAAAAENTAEAVGLVEEAWVRLARIQASNKAEAMAMVDSTEDINEAMDDQESKLNAVAAAWSIVLGDLKDGNIDTENATNSWNFLRDELHLDEDQMAALAQQKLDEKLKADAEAALALAEAMADLRDTIAEIDTDDIANIGSALQEALDETDAVLDNVKFDIDFEETFGGLVDELAATFKPDIDELAGWMSTRLSLADNPPDILGNVEIDDAEFMAKMTQVRDLVQEGIVSQFERGGVDAANAFVQSQAQVFSEATGIPIADVYRLWGLGPDGSVDAVVNPLINEEAAADAMAILSSLQGVDPDNPIPAYIKLAVQTDQITGLVGEIAAKILAGQAIGVPAKLEEFTQADIDAAVAFLAGYGITVPVDTETDTSEVPETLAGVTGATVPVGTETNTAEAATALLNETSQQRFAPITAVATATNTASDDLDDVAEDRKATIKAEATQVLSVDSKLDAIAALRTAIIEAEASGVFLTEGKLDNLADPRTARITAEARTGQAEFDLNRVARDRQSTVRVHMVTNPTGEPLSPNPQTAMEQLAAEATVEPMGLAATPLAADAGAGAVTSTTVVAPAVVRVPAPAPVTTQTINVTVQAAVVGNRYEVERTIAKAMRGYHRLNGTRN